jgi:glycosyltransferase involved in cell wall biosynthesis
VTARSRAVAPLRILHVVSVAGAGGAETYAKQLALEFRRRGDQPAIAFIDHAIDERRSVEFERLYLAELDDAGIDHFVIGRSARRNPLLGAWQMWRYCRANRIQIYHSHLKRGLLFGAFLRIPRVTTHHNGVPEVPVWAYRLFNYVVDQYVGISASCGDLLRKYSGRPVQIIRNGIDLSRFTASLRDRVTDGPFQLISVGRIFPQKNYPLLIRAIALLPLKVRQRVRLSIAGEGAADLVADLERQIRAASLQDCVMLLGNRSDIPELLERSDLFVMSSAWEGFPIALLEATASGLPFVATDVGGCREIAELCGNGVVVAAQDPQVLADAIADLVEHRDKLRRLSKAAIKSAPKLSIETAADAHIELYRDLLGERDSE